AVGTSAMYLLNTGNNNVSVGQNAGYDLTSGSNNIIFGSYNSSVGVTTGNNNIVIGNDVRVSQTGSNQLNIGNLIYATGLASGTTMSAGGIGIGTSSPQA